jgi:hypothetical protein
MHEKEPRFSPFSNEPRYLHNLARGPVPRIITSSVLYVCPYFPEDRWERETTMDAYGPWISLDVDWEDPIFRKLALEMVSPAKQLPLITPPEGPISIALHVREGGGFDTPYQFVKGSTIHPHKMPPLHFYLDGLNKAFDLVPGKTFYCFVFTDAEKPEAIVDQLKQSIPQTTPIAFDYRRKGNHHTANVLEDFFSLFHFDVLIRSQSNFSLAAARLHDFALDYAPGRFTIQGDQVHILDAEVKVREALCR